LVAALAVGGCGSDGDGEAAGDGAKEVNIALVAPLSGPYAEHGKLMRQGAEMAIDDVNAQGGIKSLGGAKLKVAASDAGATTETATNATLRALDKENVSVGMGAWLSTFTLAATEIAERSRVPFLTFSFADDITKRGYKYTFREDAPAGAQVSIAVPLLKQAAESVDTSISTAVLIGDNTAATVAYFKALRTTLPKEGVKILLDETWTPPLADPQQLALAVRRAKPDIVFAGPTTFDDTTGLVRALKAVGVKDTPILGNGGQFVSREFFDALKEDGVKNVFSVVGSGILKGQEDLQKRFVDRYGTFMVQDSLSAYTEIWIIKEALEAAKSTEPQKIREALSGLDITSGPAADIPGGGVKYDATGQNTKASVAIQQWQGDVPQTIAPVEQAPAKPEL
jgi:branched-chain amino acid transport system substrate-binding protein